MLNFPQPEEDQHEERIHEKPVRVTFTEYKMAQVLWIRADGFTID